MRREILVLVGLVTAALLIVSCSPATKYYICPDGSKVLDAQQCVAPEEQPSDNEVVATEPEPVLTPEILPPAYSAEAKVLFDKFAKVTGLQYDYVESPNVLAEYTYFTTRDKMKIKLKTKVRFSENDMYDTVYIDRTTKTALAYCEDKDRGLCPDPDKEFSADYNRFFVETPFDWMAKVTKADLTGKSKTLEARQAAEMNFEISGKAGTMFLANFNGVPLWISFEGKTYEFRSIVIGEVKASDVEHQFSE